MSIDWLEKLTHIELKNLLKDLKNYSSLVKQLWNRWRSLYYKKKNNTKTLLVEYFWVISEDLVFEEAKKFYKKFFWIDVLKEDIKFVKKDDLDWGIRIFLDDKMLDLSYLNFKNTINN